VKKYYLSILVMLLIPLAGMSTDIYLPSLPAIAAHFGVYKSLAQFTVTAYIFAMGLGQFIAGPVSDALGRKKLLVTSLSLQVLSVFAILHSPSIHWIIVLRFIQGAAAAFMIVPARAILNDIYEGDKLKKQFNYLTIAFAVGPIIAPFIGGYLQHYIGWKANFYFILIFAFVLLLVVLFILYETIAETTRFSPNKILHNYKIILTNKHFAVGSLTLGILFGYTGLFNVSGTFLIQIGMHHSAIVYGRIALLVGFAWFLGNLINRLAFHINKKFKAQIALLLSFLASLCMFILSWSGYFNLPTFVVPTFVVTLFSAVFFSTYAAECLTLFPRLAASANGALFSITWIMYSFYTFIASFLKPHSLVPISVIYILVGLVALGLYYFCLLPIEKTEDSIRRKFKS